MRLIKAWGLNLGFTVFVIYSMHYDMWRTWSHILEWMFVKIIYHYLQQIQGTL